MIDIIEFNNYELTQIKNALRVGVEQLDRLKTEDALYVYMIQESKQDLLKIESKIDDYLK